MADQNPDSWPSAGFPKESSRAAWRFPAATSSRNLVQNLWSTCNSPWGQQTQAASPGLGSVFPAVYHCGSGVLGYKLGTTVGCCCSSSVVEINLAPSVLSTPLPFSNPEFLQQLLTQEVTVPELLHTRELKTFLDHCTGLHSFILPSAIFPMFSTLLRSY